MILHRFCSAREFEKYMAGEGLENTRDHGAPRYVATTAVGFTFFVGPPRRYVPRLGRCVNRERCITVDAPGAAVRLCHSNYPLKGGGSERLVEFCTMSYDRERFRFIRRERDVETP